MQLAREGVATGLLSIPNRYMHSPCELVSLDDLDNSCKLLGYALEKIDDAFDFKPF
jgi:endoglucanase